MGGSLGVGWWVRGGAGTYEHFFAWSSHSQRVRQEAAVAPPATQPFAGDQVVELRVALDAAHAALEERAAELAAVWRLVAERDAATAERKAAVISEQPLLQAQQATIAAAVDSATGGADAVCRTLEHLSELISARLVSAAGSLRVGLDAAHLDAALEGQAAEPAAAQLALAERDTASVQVVQRVA